MEHYKLRKYRGPEVWARVRAAYVAGEPGPQVAARFDVGPANLRKKALKEGWTRTAAAAQSDPLILATQPDVLGLPDPAMTYVDPGQARADAIARASALLAEGRASEATVLLKAAETLARAAGLNDGPVEEDPTAAGHRRALEYLRNLAAVEKEACELAQRMLADTFDGLGPNAHAAYHWRAEHLGPDAIARDRAYALAQRGSLDSRYWTEDGELKPLDHVWDEKQGIWW